MEEDHGGDAERASDVLAKLSATLPVWTCVRVRMRRRPSYTILQVSRYLFISLSLSLSLVLSEAGMRSTNLSPVHIPTLSITDSSLLPSCLFVSSSCCNDNPVLISPVSASVSPKCHLYVSEHE